jgi:hypothetical protein
MAESMAESLRKRDTRRTGIPQSARTLILLAVMGAYTFLAAQKSASDIDRRLEAAIYKETVMGDLTGAMEDYKAILARADKPRDVAARALYQLAQCHDKLGQRAAAQSAYRRVAGEYGDQTAIAALARGLASFAGPRNLNFEEGVVGKVPPGWTVPVLPKDPNFSAELRRSGCRSNSGCAVVLVSPTAPRPFGTMMQSASAEGYRGKTVRLRAWLRVEAAKPEDSAQMRLAVDRDGFWDNRDNDPVVRSAEWTRCDIIRKIDEDARFILIAVMSNARGRVWVDDISFEVVPDR